MTDQKERVYIAFFVLHILALNQPRCFVLVVIPFLFFLYLFDGNLFLFLINFNFTITAIPPRWWDISVDGENTITSTRYAWEKIEHKRLQSVVDFFLTNRGLRFYDFHESKTNIEHIIMNWTTTIVAYLFLFFPTYRT